MNAYLDSELHALAAAFEAADVRLVLGGGAGIELRRRRLRLNDPALQPLLPPPIARTTEDLDVLLPVEVLVKPDTLQSIRNSLDARGYVPYVKFKQFVRTIPDTDPAVLVKVDLLGEVPQQDTLESFQVKNTSGRIRSLPSPSPTLHAWPTDELLPFADTAVPMLLPSTSEHPTATVWLAPVVPYLVLKLHAHRDRRLRSRESREAGDTDAESLHTLAAQKHAYDVYALLGTTTADEWRTAQASVKGLRDRSAMHEAARLVAANFTAPTQDGLVDLAEQSRILGYDFADGALTQMQAALRTLFPPAP